MPAASEEPGSRETNTLGARTLRQATVRSLPGFFHKHQNCVSQQGLQPPELLVLEREPVMTKGGVSGTVRPHISTGDLHSFTEDGRAWRATGASLRGWDG